SGRRWSGTLRTSSRTSGPLASSGAGSSDSRSTSTDWRATMNSPGLPGLPSLRFRTAFRNYDPYVRAATLVASVPVPVICLAIFFWLQPVWREINITVLVILPVVAVVSPAVFLKQNAIPHAVNLTPAAIEHRELARRTSVPTSEVSQVITVRTARREVFMVRDRGGKFVAF